MRTILSPHARGYCFSLGEDSASSVDVDVDVDADADADVCVKMSS